MLDLDAIANRRAAALGQDGGAWREAVWATGFQNLSARLTDGEVLELLSSCASARELGAVTDALGQVPRDAAQTPFDWLKAEASRAGVTLDQFIKRSHGG